MELKVRTLSEEAGLRDRFREFHRQAWPRFVHEGDGAGPLWSRIFTDFADFQFGLWDETGVLVAVGNSIPLICDGTKADLPPNIPEILERGVAVKRDDRRPTALSALAAIVDPAAAIVTNDPGEWADAMEMSLQIEKEMGALRR